MKWYRKRKCRKDMKREMNSEIGFWEYIKLRFSTFVNRKKHQYKHWEKNSTTDTSFKIQSTGEARYIWWHEWEDEEKND